MTRSMAWLPVVLAASWAVACADPEPSFGDPGEILRQRLPGDTAASDAPGGSFGSPFDPAANKPTTTLTRAHAAGGGPEGGDALDCLSCHVADSSSAANKKPFAFGGRVKKGTPLSDVDVLVVVNSEKFGPVKSDAEGFFWLAGPALPAGGRVSVRNARAESRMGGALTAGPGGACTTANCHGGRQGPAGTGL